MNKIYQAILGICFFAHGLCGSSSSGWQFDDVNEGWKYFHNSELQRQWAWHLLASHHFSGHERVLDFGCGDGKITAEVAHFLSHGEIVGVDISTPMITFARRCFPHAYYPNLTFEKSDDLEFNRPFSGKKYDVIYSLCVFHLVANPIQILKNLRECLTDNGKLLLVIPSGKNPAFFQAAQEAFDHYQLQSPWSKGVGSAMRTQEGLLQCLKDAGLTPSSIVEFHTPTAFYNKQELVEWMIGTMAANWQIPLDIAEAFFTDVVGRMEEIDPHVADPSGGYMMKISRFEVKAEKQILDARHPKRTSPPFFVSRH
jgi:trans-aconitate 2-methyltransferase